MKYDASIHAVSMQVQLIITRNSQYPYISIKRKSPTESTISSIPVVEVQFDSFIKQERIVCNLRIDLRLIRLTKQHI